MTTADLTYCDGTICRICDFPLNYGHESWCYGNGQVRWGRLRSIILERDNHTCRYCDAAAEHVDHVIPRSRGGLNAPWNLIASCASCNLQKWSHVYYWAIEWERRRSDYEAACEAAWATDASCGDAG